jgi:copper resistance protein B
MSARTFRCRIAPMLIAQLLATAATAQPCDGNEPVHAHSRDTACAVEDVATEAKADHVPPPAPEHPMPAMDAQAMRSAMAMDDSAPIATIRADRLELADGGDGVAAAWKVAASFGDDFDKLLLRSEGERADGHTERADAEVLWDHAIAAFWDAELGLRQDFGRGAHRTWAAIGVQGLAPYGFEIGTTAYAGAGGRTALRFEVDYELLLTQRLVLEPRVELNAYGKDDPASRVGAGLSDAAFGLRLRYEIRREFAPYIGIERSEAFGRSADFARTDDRDVRDTRWVIGLRVWY